MIVNILVTVFGILFLFFFSAYVITLKKLKQLNNDISQMLVLFELMQQGINTEEDKDIHKENFIKFLSDSRDWAFDYIDNVQAGIKKFVTEIQPEIDHYNKFGIVVEGIVAPHDFALKKISKELDELKKLLPEENSDRR